jgi:excisionase family DNA binding protein
VYTVPDLHVPSFDVRIPRWGEIDAAPETECAEVLEAVAEIGAKGGATQTVSGAVARIKASPNWDLLNQIREEEAGDPSRARLRETRKELIERLVDPTLSLEQTAVILGVCPTTVRRYTNKGLLRHFRTKGNQRRFRLSDVAEFMEARSAEIEADSRADQAAGTTEITGA